MNTFLGICALPFWFIGIMAAFVYNFTIDGYYIGNAKYIEIKTGRVGQWLQSNQNQQD